MTGSGEEGGNGVTGFMPPPLPDAAWLLNAMYGHEDGPSETSYDEYHRARVADGDLRPLIVAGMDPTRLGTATGGGPGRGEHPGAGWRRLRWAELARRVGDPPVPEGLLPSYRCFPSVRKGAAGRSASARPPRAAWTARPGTG